MILTKWLKRSFTMMGVVGILVLSGCGLSNQTSEEASNETKSIIVDGSSTVFPITSAVAEEFRMKRSDVDIQVSQSGTGGGMKKLAAGEIDVCNASRKIKDSEAELAKKNNISYKEIMVGYDGIVVVVNSKNNWLDQITVEQLKKIWEPESKVMLWSDIDEKWPKKEIKLFGPGTDSGTFDYFTEEIMGEAKAIRKDYTPSEDDNLLVTGVTSDEYAMGYFGYAYYLENKSKLKALKIENGKGGTEPNMETIKDGSYSPLSRPLFIYVNQKSIEKPHIKEFIEYYLKEGREFVKDVGYVPLTDMEYDVELKKVQ